MTIVERLSRHLGQPTWPVPMWNFPSTDAQHDAEAVLRKTLAGAGVTESVFALDSFHKPIPAAKDLTKDEREVHDWFAYLGLSPRESGE